MIRDFEGSSGFYLKTKGNTRILEILMKVENYMNFRKKYPQGNIVISVRKKIFLLQNIENKSIHEVLVENKLLRGLKPKETIDITFSNRQLGGCLLS